MKLDTKVYMWEWVRGCLSLRLKVLAELFIRVEAGQLRGHDVHVFVLEDQYQIIKKFVF